MYVVGHEVKGVDTVAKPAGSFLKQQIEPVTVGGGEEDGLTAVATENDVIKSAGNMDAWFTCHGGMTPQFSNFKVAGTLIVGDFSFSALITGIAIVHTTGMPVFYSFELVLLHPYQIRPSIDPPSEMPNDRKLTGTERRRAFCGFLQKA